MSTPLANTSHLNIEILFAQTDDEYLAEKHLSKISSYYTQFKNARGVSKLKLLMLLYYELMRHMALLHEPTNLLMERFWRLIYMFFFHGFVLCNITTRTTDTLPKFEMFLLVKLPHSAPRKKSSKGELASVFPRLTCGDLKHQCLALPVGFIAVNRLSHTEPA